MTTARLDRPSCLRSSTADWVVNPSEEGLVGPSAPNWFELDRDPRASVVKSGRHRQTWRVALNDRVIFAKVFDTRRGNVLGRLAFALGLGTSHREWQASRAAECRGVRAVRCLGLGVDRRQRGRAVLLSEGLPNAISLGQAWEEASSRRDTALSLIQAVAKLFAAAHDRGFVHRDAHPGNILVQPTADDGCEAMFIDVHGAYLFHHQPSKRCVVRSLAQLDHYFHRRATRMQRWRFLRSYLTLRQSFAERSERRGFSRDLLSSISRARAAHAATLARQRDRRIRRNGKYFITTALGQGWKGIFVLMLERRHAFPEAHVPDRSEHDWRNLLQAVFMSDGWQCNDDRFAIHGVHVERARPIGIRARMSWSLIGSPQRREFVQSHQLRHRDIPSELLLACLEHRSAAGLIDEAILVRATTSLKS